MIVTSSSDANEIVKNAANDKIQNKIDETVTAEKFETEIAETVATEKLETEIAKVVTPETLEKQNAESLSVQNANKERIIKGLILLQPLSKQTTKRRPFNGTPQFLFQYPMSSSISTTSMSMWFILRQ